MAVRFASIFPKILKVTKRTAIEYVAIVYMYMSFVFDPSENAQRSAWTLEVSSNSEHSTYSLHFGSSQQ